MEGFKESAVVQVYAGKDALGSGYDLGNGRVLTAKHVVGGRRTVCVRSQGQSDRREMEVAWPGTGEIDVAVLRPCGAAEELVDAPSVWFFDGDPRGRQWDARGFPALLGDKSIAVRGDVQGAQDAKTTCELSVTTSPEDARGWKGVSGAAMFVEDRLFAVLQSASGLLRGALRAVPIVYLLLSDEEMRAAVGLPTLDDRRTMILKSIKDRIAAVPKLKPWLGVGSPRWKAADPVCLAEAILSEPSAVDLAVGFKKAMHALKEGREAVPVAEALREIFEHALPFVMGSRTGAHGAVGRRDLATSYPQNAEAFMAWERGGRMKMRRPGGPKDYPLPEGYVEIYSAAVPEDGMGHEGRVEDAAEVIATRSQRLAKDWYAREGNENLFDHQSWQRKLSSINAQMKAMDGLTFFALARGAERSEEQGFLTLLAEKLDAVRLIVPRLSPDDEQADDDLLHNLGQFYLHYHELVGGRS